MVNHYIDFLNLFDSNENKEKWYLMLYGRGYFKLPKFS